MVEKKTVKPYKVFSRNEVLVMKNIRKVNEFIDGTNTHNDKCKALVGVDIDGLKSYLEEKFNDKISWENYKKKWDIGFYLRPYNFDMKNAVDRGTCFYYENLYPKLQVVSALTV
jgi:hypothetical protein